MTRTALAVLVLVLAAACGRGADDPDPQADVVPAPQETVTVTETAAAPEPTEDDTAPPQQADVCADETLDEVAFIFVTSPVPGEEVSNPFTVRGCSNTFEANLQWRLVDRDGAIITEGHETASCGSGCVGTFEFEVRYPEEEPRLVTLEVYETSAEDGSEEFVNSIPVRTNSAS